MGTGDPVVDDRQVVMRLERNGTAVDRDSELNRRLAGDLLVEERTAQAAYCVNGWYWAEDVTLDKLVLVATSPRLVRVAEVVEAGDIDVAMAAAVEHFFLDTDVEPEAVGVLDLPVEVRDRWDLADLGAYLEATSAPPSAGASQRFVAYAVSTTTSEQYVYIVDLERADRGAISLFAQDEIWNEEVLVAGSGTNVSMKSGDCDELDFP
jgi:hypothetical protein